MSKKGKSILIATAVLVVSIVLMSSLSAMKKTPERRGITSVKQRVSTVLVKNSNLPIGIAVYGMTTAVEKVDVYAEVSGILESTSSKFLAGNTFKKGELLLDINKDEAEASLKSLKSNFLTQLSSLLVELKYNFPQSYNAWENYIDVYSVENPISELPEVNNEKEKIYISTQGIYDAYYSILSQEIRLSKYKISAAFDGILTESYVKPGMLIMSGQKLGSYVKDEFYDLEVAVKLSDLHLLSIGDTAELLSPVTGLEIEGEVNRINSTVDQMTQTVSVYVRVKGDGVKDNMFFEGEIKTSQSYYGMEISRKILQENSYVYTIDSVNIVHRSPVSIYQKYDDKVIVGGLNDGCRIADRSSGIYEGLEVVTDDEQPMPVADMLLENGTKGN